MTSTNNEAKLITFTGVPAVGKTSCIEEAMRLCLVAGVKPVKIIDYPLLKRWAQNNRKSEHLVVYPSGAAKDSDDFMVRLEAYAEASLAVIPELAQAIAAEVSPDKVFLTEAGMGAGDPRTNYGDHYFDPLAVVLKDMVLLANAQIVIPDTNTLMERARRRYKDSNHKAPPPEVTERYLHNGVAQSSLPFAEASGFDVIYNREIDNSYDESFVLAQVAIMMIEVLER